MRDVDVDGSNKVNFADFQSISTWAIRVWNGDCVGPKAMVCELMGSPAASVYRRRLGSDRKVFGARPRGRNLQGKLARAAMVRRAGGSSNTCGSSLPRRDVQAFRLFDEDRTGKISLKVRTFMHPVAPMPPRARAVRAVLTHCGVCVCVVAAGSAEPSTDNAGAGGELGRRGAPGTQLAARVCLPAVDDGVRLYDQLCL